MYIKTRVIDGETEQRCTKCLEWLPQDGEFFWRSKKTLTGYSSRCKACYWEYPCMQRRMEKKKSKAGGKP